MQINLDIARKVLRTVNFEKCLNDTSGVIFDITKRAIRKIQKADAMPIGRFMKELSNEDLDEYYEYVNEMTDHGENEDLKGLILQNFILVSHLLALSEGLQPSDDDIVFNIKYFATAISLTYLEREGLIDLKYENLSFDEEVQKPIACIKPGIDPSYFKNED